jgi:GxGYxYP putative glycoside hydrolase C-terminal domain
MFYILIVLNCIILANCITTIDLRSGIGNSEIIAIKSIVGIQNRYQPTSYTIESEHDMYWLNNLTIEKHNVSPNIFLKKFLYKRRTILYKNGNYLPSVMTLGSIHNLIPVDEILHIKYNTTLVVDSIMWKSQKEGVSEALKWINYTTTLAIQSSTEINKGNLVDWIMSEKLFTFYVKDQCIPFTNENRLFKKVIAQSKWPTPISVYGYNFQNKIFGAYPWEAETSCIKSLGQIASNSASNLSFFKNYKKAKTKSLKQPDEDLIIYNKSKIYVTLIYGDLDNIDFVQTIGKKHLLERVQRCKLLEKNCFPLVWTLNPNLLYISPTIIEWYYHLAYQTRRDWFILPPSGSLYSYPTLMSDTDQINYIKRQNAQSLEMNTTGSIHWELMLTWDKTFKKFFPKYSLFNQSKVYSFFLNNVPWLIPIIEWPDNKRNYHWVTNNVVVFKPAFNWDPNEKSGGNPHDYKYIANKINNLRKGSLNYVYVIQQTPIKDIFDMVDNVNDSVQFIGYQGLQNLAAFNK